MKKKTEKKLTMFQSVLRRRKGQALAEKGLWMAAAIAATAAIGQYFQDNFRTVGFQFVDDMVTESGKTVDAYEFEQKTNTTSMSSTSNQNLGAGMNQNNSESDTDIAETYIK